ADLAGVLKYGHEDVRNALERASARHTAVHVAAGAVAKALLAELGVVVAGRAIEIGGATGDEGMREATDAARADRDTLGGIVEVVATGVPPGLGSYAEKADRLDARLAARLMGIQAGKAVGRGAGLAVVAEAAVAWELARAAREKFGGDALVDMLAAHRSYLARIGDTWRR